MEYTIERLTDYEATVKDKELIYFFYNAGVKLSAMHDNKLDWSFFNLAQYITHHRFMLCRRDGKPVGIHLSKLTRASLDSTKIILFQDLLYTLPNTRAAKLLMDDFIDFGKRNANHIITTIGEKTNIKPSSLKKLGFNKLETLYCLES